MEIFKNDQEKKGFITNYQNPFKSDKVRKIEFTIESSSWFKDKTEYKSMVRFQSGDTSGYHRMEADDFSSLFEKTEMFIKSL